MTLCGVIVHWKVFCDLKLCMVTAKRNKVVCSNAQLKAWYFYLTVDDNGSRVAGTEPDPRPSHELFIIIITKLHE